MAIDGSWCGQPSCSRRWLKTRQDKTGHNTLHRHMTLLQKEEWCFISSVCEEQQETSQHFLGRCTATMDQQMKYLKWALLGPYELRQEHWATPLRPTRDFNNLWLVNMVLHTGPIGGLSTGGRGNTSLKMVKVKVTFYKFTVSYLPLVVFPFCN